MAALPHAADPAAEEAGGVGRRPARLLEAAERGGCANCVRFRFKEEYTQEQKAKAGKCAGCVKGYMDASFMAKGAEMECLVADLGLDSPA